MSLIVSDTGGPSIEPTAAGNHHAVCYAVVDLGTQAGGNYGPKPKVLFSWELPFERGKFTKDGHEVDLPRVVSETYTLSLAESANLRAMLKGWRGRDFTPEELKAFDLKKVLMANCMLNVIHNKGTGKNANKTYANVAGVSPLAKGMTARKPENPILFFSFAEHPKGAAVLPDHMPEWIVKMVKQADEWTDSPPASATKDTGAGSSKGPDDDVPF